MRTKRKTFLTFAVAALVLLSAAICAAENAATPRQKAKPTRRGARTTTTTTRKTTQPAAATTTPVKQNPPAAGETDDAPPQTTPAPAKRNARATSGETPTATEAKSAGVNSGAQGDDGVAAKKTDAKADATAARYAYEFKQPEMSVHHIRIEHDSAGRGQISFERISDMEPLVEPFALSAGAWARIKSSWDALRFLDSDENYQTERQYAHLGTQRLTLKQGARQRIAEFNYTHNTDAAALVNEYRRAADQAILVFEIGVALELQPLEMTRQLNRLAALLDRDALSDPQQLLPLLRDLRTDERVPLIARNHAERLLKKIEKNSSTGK